MSELLIKKTPVRIPFIICFFLVIVIVLLYFPVTKYGFVGYDDVEYVAKNSQVKRGLTTEGVKWAFFAFYESNWHPLTWISHMIDIELFGFDIGKHHAINIVFHVLNTLMLFVFFSRATGKVCVSAITTALFAIHPVHVESVAWIAERKDVLSTFFFMLTLHSYLQYTISKRKLPYYLALIFFAFGLMSKPMLVTLPCILLLLDYWPLGRILIRKERCFVNNHDDIHLYPIMEKAPFFVLSFLTSCLTILAQKSGGSVASIKSIPFSMRIPNAFVAYFKYFVKIIYPADLAVLYPYPSKIPFNILSIAIVVIGLFMLLALYNLKSRTYIGFGLLWFFGTLVPVIGILQVGSQAMADRYLYIPAIGIYLIIAMLCYEFSQKYQIFKKCASAFFLLYFIFLAIKTSIQITYWKDGETLFRHAISVTEKNIIAYGNLGVYLSSLGRRDEAIKSYLKAVEIVPFDSELHKNLGVEYNKKGDHDNAIKHFEMALKFNPNQVESLSSLAAIVYERGDIDKSIDLIERAIKINSNDYSIYSLMGMILMRKGAYVSSLEFYSKALELSPENPHVLNNMGAVFERQGKLKDAIFYFSEALSIDPSNKMFRNNFDIVQSKLSEQQVP